MNQDLYDNLKRYIDTLDIYSFKPKEDTFDSIWGLKIVIDNQYKTNEWSITDAGHPNYARANLYSKPFMAGPGMSVREDCELVRYLPPV